MKLKNIDVIMAERCISSGDLARAASIGGKTLYNARTGASIRPQTAGAIAKALDVPINEIIDN